MRGHTVRNSRRVGRFDAKQHQVCLAQNRQIGSGGNAHALHRIGFGQVQLQAMALYRLHMRGPADQRDLVPGACQHGAKKTANGARANDDSVLNGRCAHTESLVAQSIGWVF